MRRRLFSWSVSLFVVISLASAVAGCRIDDAPEPAGVTLEDEISPDGVRISLIAPVFPPPAGDGRLVIRVADKEDQPIDTATVQIRGDMTHAGMLPIEASAAEGEDGVYHIPVRWTMTGEWIVTVEATLDDGRRAARSFALTVTGEEEPCIDGP